MSRLTDFFKTGGQYEHSPMMHVQDQQASGTSKTEDASTVNTQTLNTIISNEIVGASLSSNAITLPAGTYYVKGSSPVVMAGISRLRLTDFTTDHVTGTNGYGFNSGYYSGSDSVLDGMFTLNTSKTFYLVLDCSTAPGVNRFPPLANGVFERYSELQIWQLDAIKTSPIIHDNKLYPLPGNTYVTGGMYGLEYSYTSANSITVDAGICYDSLNTTILTGSASQVVAIGTTINQIYNLFLCDDGLVKTDTDVEGTTLLAGAVTALRWIGFVLTDSAGNIVEFKHSQDVLSYPVHVVSGIGTTKTAIDFSNVVPVSRVNSIATRVELNINSAVVYFYNTSGTVGYIRASRAGDLLIMRHMNIVGYAVHTNTGVVNLVLTECILKR